MQSTETANLFSSGKDDSGYMGLPLGFKLGRNNRATRCRTVDLQIKKLPDYMDGHQNMLNMD